MKNTYIIPAVLTLSSVFAFNPAIAETATNVALQGDSAFSIHASKNGSASINSETTMQASSKASSYSSESSEETASNESNPSSEFSANQSATVNVAINTEGGEALMSDANALGNRLVEGAQNDAESLVAAGTVVLENTLTKSTDLAGRVASRTETAIQSSVDNSIAIVNEVAVEGSVSVEDLIDASVMNAISSAAEASLESALSQNLEAVINDTVDENIENTVESSVAASINNTVNSAFDI